jgi:hypothetical protein
MFESFKAHIDKFGILLHQGKSGGNNALATLLKKYPSQILTELNKPENDKYKKAYDEFINRKIGRRSN